MTCDISKRLQDKEELKREREKKKERKQKKKKRKKKKEDEPLQCLQKEKQNQLLQSTLEGQSTLCLSLLVFIFSYEMNEEIHWL
jgi:hypothetical protein